MSRLGEYEEIKVVVMDQGGAGKSALIIRFVTDQFLCEYDPTIEDSYRKTHAMSDMGTVVLLDILDTAGQEEFFPLQDQWHREAQILIIVYSIDSRLGIDEAEIHYDKVQRAKDDEWDGKFPVILVGNKCDLEEQRVVEKSQAETLQKSWKNENSVFIECSARTKLRVNELFETVVRTLWKAREHKSDATAQKLKMTLPIPTVHCTCCSNCNCSCFNICDWYHALRYESITGDKQNQKDKIKFYKNDAEPLPDIIPAPIYSLKNFNVKRIFNTKRFFISILCGIFIPIVIILQTIAFLMYSEFKPAIYYPKFYPYEDIHAAIFYDFLGIVIGRKPGQDPETVKDRRWFLRQTKLQKLKRVLATVIITLISFVCFYNITQVNNDRLRVSLMETIGPFLLFWCVWLLLSLWIAYEIELKPQLPSALDLRSVVLYLGERYKHKTTVYKFLRAYYASLDRKWMLPRKTSIMIGVLGLLYALIPGLTRVTVGDPSDGLEKKKFITRREMIVSIGAMIVNFALVTSFTYAIEVQYRKHFDNYKEWMYDVTMLLHKDTEDHDTDKEEHYTVEKGKNFSKNIFLSLTRRTNALGWLEIRSFLAVEGKILFAEQELPTSFILLLTVSLSIFILFRVYIIGGFPLRSILFNGCIMLSIILVASLIRIAITGYRFEKIQQTQQRLLGEQKFFMRCHKTNTADIERIASPKMRKLMMQTHQDRYRKLSVAINDTKMGTLKTDNKEEEEDDEEDAPLLGTKSSKERPVIIEIDDDVEDDEKEDAPLLGNNYRSNEATTLSMVRDKVEQMDWYSHNVGFIDDMLYVVQTKDIYPRLFGIKLNDVLAKAIAGAFVTAVASIFRLFIK